MKVALVSLNQKWEDKAHNLERCETLVARCAALGADLVIFPEMTLTAFTMNTTLSAEDAGTSASITAFSKVAARHAVALIVGVVLKTSDEAKAMSANTLIAFSASGVEQARYTKMHPFSFAGENNYFKPGEAIAKMQMAEFNLGLTICYDLRFPELYSALAKDCDVLVNIANWPKRRIQHWKTLLQARAIENQTYVIGVNRTGIDGNGLEYEHSSMIFNANGELLKPLISDGEIEVFEFNLESLQEFKNGFSTKQDRQTDLYRIII